MMHKQEEVHKKSPVKGNYHNDYSPKYGPAYDIYDKAKEHMKNLRRQEQKEG